MKLSVQKLFEKDIRSITDKKLAKQVSEILDSMEICENLKNFLLPDAVLLIFRAAHYQPLIHL